jgi:adenylosuccinate synthase
MTDTRRNTTVVVGGQYGDEGKGKIISFLAKQKWDVIGRAGVGPNAGHSVWHNGTKYALSLLPSGFLNKEARLLVGAGVSVDPKKLIKEITTLNIDPKMIGIDFNCTVITDKHIELDINSTNSQKIGTTKTGCGPAVASRANRIATLARDCPELKPYLTEVSLECNNAKNVLIEASQGFMLSVLYGTYPFTTSKDTAAATAIADVGIGPMRVKDVIMVIKSYTTRVGSGPMGIEMSAEEAKNKGMSEFGTVTGRARRISEDLDFENLKLAARINSASQIALTKLDVKFPETKGVREWKNLSDQSKLFIKNIEDKLRIPVIIIGTGAEVDDVCIKRVVG